MDKSTQLILFTILGVVVGGAAGSEINIMDNHLMSVVVLAIGGGVIAAVIVLVKGLLPDNNA